MQVQGRQETKNRPIPNPVVRRLSLYLRQLETLVSQGASRVSSRQMAESLYLTAAQVRKDLAYFGQFGRAGVGYEVTSLTRKLRDILGTNKTRNVIVVGIGGLGGAMLRHEKFQERGFNLIAAVDIDPDKVGRKIGSVVVSHMDDLHRIVLKHRIKLAIVTVPAQSAQVVANALYEAGVSGILNFTPVNLAPLESLAVEPVDIAACLEHLCFHVNSF